MKTVAYIEDRAVGLAALVPLACRDIVFKKTARMGDVRQSISGRNGQLHDLSDGQIAGLADKAAVWARLRGHPEAVARAMVDPEAEVLEAKDTKTGGTRLILRSELDAEPGRYQVLQTRKEPGIGADRRRPTRPPPTAWARSSTTPRSSRRLYGLRGRDDPRSRGPAGSTRSSRS